MNDRTAENWFDFEGHRVFYRREGAGDRLLFLPNATLTGRLWQHQAAYFRSRYEVLTVDMPGFGRSDRIKSGLTLDLYVRWLERLVSELELAPLALVGNCIGSLTAVHYAARQPDKVSAATAPDAQQKGRSRTSDKGTTS